VDAARAVLSSLRALDSHRFLADDVSITDSDVPAIIGHRQVTDAHLLTLARRHEVRLVTFDAGAHALDQGRDVELLTVLQPRQPEGG
jgi:predicted nucleic acid-binding protein